VKIAIAKGKKNYDKREAIREREDKRSIQRAIKESE
jgi:tmRNA-binding protein